LKIRESVDQQYKEYIGQLEGLPKTNNSVEGWHKAFLSLLAATHPTVWQ